MRRIRYAVAASLDGYIAGPNGEADWIIMDPEIDFEELFRQFDTMLLGRKTYEAALEQQGAAEYGMPTNVFSRTLRQKNHPKVTVVADKTVEVLNVLKEAPGMDIWLKGGGLLCRSLLGLGLVDTVKGAVIPILLGAGIPLLPSPAKATKMKLAKHRL